MMSYRDNYFEIGNQNVNNLQKGLLFKINLHFTELFLFSVDTLI